MRLGIDIGGTFTDFVVLGNGSLPKLAKVPSVPDRPAAAISEGLEVLATELGCSVGDLIRNCDVVVHGTTVATNALIQGGGALTGLLCTEGFRDSFEIRQGYKEERYDFLYPPPRMLVPRFLRRPIRERIGKDGQIFAPLDEVQARSQIEILAEHGVEAIAISLLWSFLNSKHEERLAALVEELMPGTFLSVSSRLAPQIREYDRTSTTVVNAFVGPTLARYIDEVHEVFAFHGSERSRVRFIQTNGGIASGQALARRPLYALNSGPAAAPSAGLHFGGLIGTDNLITIDMGGTSFDVCLVEEGLPDIVKNVDVCRYRLAIPMVNVNTIGAGGGSIAWLDSGILRVGPLSAEAVPGPACYGRGGTRPTVTDANLVLGYFDPHALLGGEVELNQAAAVEAIEREIARPSGLSLDEASHGIFEVVNHNMVNGIREVSVERGYDPRDFVLVAGGGAGGTHASRLASALGMTRVLIPRVASAFCAFGEVAAELRHDYVASHSIPVRIDALDLDAINLQLQAMEHQGRVELEEEGVSTEDIALERTLEMRYAGQLHECRVTAPSGRIDEAALTVIRERFHNRHEALYAYSDREDGVCELINMVVTASGRRREIAAPELSPSPGDRETSSSDRTRAAYFPELGGYCEIPVYRATGVAAGATLRGPAVIDETTTSIMLFPGDEITLDARGFYELKVGSQPSATLEGGSNRDR